jgi:hypothetical protein
VREELYRASEALLRPLGVAIEVGILPVVTATGVVLNRFSAVGFRFDMFVESVAFGKVV